MENIKVEMTLQREGKPDMRVELTLLVDGDEILNIDFQKLLTLAQMN